MISSGLTVSTSAAIWANMVSLPVPRSVAPRERLNDPSSFIFMYAAPMSISGMLEPCIRQTIPAP